MFKNLMGQFLGDLDRGSIKFVFDDGYSFSFNGKQVGPDAIINIHSIKFIRRLITRGYLGLAEGYIAKDWSTPSLPGVFEFGTANENVLVAKLSGKIIENIADKRWNGQVCARPGSHGYNRALLSSVIAANGEAAAKAWASEI